MRTGAAQLGRSFQVPHKSVLKESAPLPSGFEQDRVDVHAQGSAGIRIALTPFFNCSITFS